MATKDKKRPASRPVRSNGTKVKSTSRKIVRRRRKAEDPQIVYTQPPAFNKSGFLIRLATVVAVVLALTLGMSIFFKVEKITVSGNEKYTVWDIRQASGIQEGENLLTLSKAMVSGKIRAELPYVYGVQVGIKLPDTVNIEITELDVAYAIEADDANWWLMNADGKLLEKITEPQAQGYTRVLGVQVTGPQAGQQAVAAEEIEDTTGEDEALTEDASEPSAADPVIPVVTVLGSQRLEMAISILQHLESNSVIGAVTTVDVTSITQLELKYEDRYQVLLGDNSQLDKKIRSMKEAVEQMTDYQNGKLDVSFTTWPDMVGFTPSAEEDS